MKTLAIILLLCFSVVSGCDAWGNYRARSFCSKVPPGSDISVLLSAERAENLQHYIVPETGAYRYGFQGYLFSSGICEFSIENGKVTATRSYHHILR